MELRADIAAAAEKMIARDRVNRELRQLAACLHEGEVVHRLSSGTYPAGYGLLAITDHRVVLLRGGSVCHLSNEFRLERLSTVDWSPGLLTGKITIADPSSCTQLGQVELAEGEEIVRLIRTRIGPASNTPPPRTWFLRPKPRHGRSTTAAEKSTTGGGGPHTAPESASAAPRTAPDAASAEHANADRTPFMPRARSYEAPPARARSNEELDTQRLEVGGLSPHAAQHRLRQSTDLRPWRRAWPVAAAAALIGLVSFGSYQLLSEHSGTPDISGTSELAAMNTTPIPPTPAVAENTNPVVGVLRVIDADSLEVAGGASGPVEVLGIQAPHDGQCGAEESTSFATNKLNGTVITLVADPAQPSPDGAGRLLAHVKLADGMDYAVLAARAGMVKYYESGPPVLQADQIKAAQAEAQRSNKGLWGAPCNGSGTGSTTREAAGG